MSVELASREDAAGGGSRNLRLRTHLSLEKDSPDTRAVQRPDLGRILETPLVGGLHHRYTRLTEGTR